MPRTLRAVTFAAVATFSSLLIAFTSTAASADPSVTEVERQMDVLAEQLNVVVEQYNDAREDLKEVKAQAASAAERARPLQKKVDALHDRVATIANSAYKGGNAAAVNALLSGGSPTTLVDQIATLDQIVKANKAEIDGLEDAKRTLAAERARLTDLVVRQTRTERSIAAKKAAIEKEIKRLEELRKRVAARASRDTTRTAPPKPAAPTKYIPGARGKIVNFAYAQLGKPYVFGNDGPNSYDCSGLTLAAYRLVGIALPHSSRRQHAMATIIPKSALQPGDLVWFYSDLHHVAIYVGDGAIIVAPKTGDVVKRVTWDRAGPYNSSGRFLR